MHAPLSRPIEQRNGMQSMSPFRDSTVRAQRRMPLSAQARRGGIGSRCSALAVALRGHVLVERAAPHILPLPLCFAMAGNKRALHPVIKELIIQLSLRLGNAAIAETLEISERTVRRVKALVYKTGSVVKIPVERGRPRMLSALHCAVCFFSIIPVSGTQTSGSFWKV